jgi:Ni/Co efflux regulator RcnB
MKRLILSLLAVAAVAGPLPLGSAAVAKDKPDHQAQRGDYGNRGGDRGGPSRGRGGEGWRENNRGRGAERGGGERGASERGGGERRDYERRGGDRGEWRAPPRSDYGPPPGYGYAPPRAYGLRRGGYMPPQVQGGVVEDYGRFRLRPPPRGYDWVRVGDDFLLVAPDGQIFDMIRP